MPTAREIRVRIDSIRQTRKITNAMYLISSAKMRKAKQEWDQTRPYFLALKAEVKRIFRTSGLMRDKWDRRQAGTTYGAISIRNTVNTCAAVYVPVNAQDIVDEEFTRLDEDEAFQPDLSKITVTLEEMAPTRIRAMAVMRSAWVTPLQIISSPLRVTTVSAVSGMSMTVPSGELIQKTCVWRSWQSCWQTSCMCSP